ncbi:secretion/conjugation apparatus DotM-related subunit [Kozakia baliensis]
MHPNPRVEAAGARAHWEAERRAKRPLYTPALDAALHTIRPA